jgi:undecaprenyl-diphosphatase
MTMIQAALLGLLQGLTEFLPVSSSGHLVLARGLMGLADVPVLFDVVLHVATLVVVVWAFRRRIGAILAALGRAVVRRTREGDRTNLVLAGYLAAASAVTAAMGLGMSRFGLPENPRTVSAMMLVTAALLLSTLFARPSRSAERLGWGRSLLLGAAQGIGVLPGISRSGITIGTGLWLGLDRESAGEFSFLLSLPAVGGAFLLSLKDAAELTEAVPALSLAAGFLAALAAGYGALRLLLWLVRRGRLWIFALYLVPLGILGLLLL